MRRGRGKRAAAGIDVGLTVKPLSCMRPKRTKQRDAFRRADTRRSRSVAYGRMSASAVSWAAPSHACTRGDSVAVVRGISWPATRVAEPRCRCRRSCVLPVRRMLSRQLRLSGALHVQTTTRSRNSSGLVQAPAGNDPSADTRAQAGAWLTRVSCAQDLPKRLRQDACFCCRYLA